MYYVTQKKYSNYLFIFSLSLYGCFGPGVGDYSYNLSGNFQLFHIGETSRTSGDSRIIDDDYNQIIAGNIVNIAWDENYICTIQERLGYQYYWIINVNTGDLYGPLDKSEYESKSTDLEISTNLKFKHPKKFIELES